MRTCALLVLSGLALVVAACATVETPTPPGASPASPAGEPSPVAGYDWFFHAEDGSARLAYGLAESDDLKLALECAQGSGTLALNSIAAKGARSEIHLESGGETERFRAASEPSQIHDGVFLTSEAPSGHPVFQRFRRIGWMAQWRGDAREAYAPQPASRSNIERFFAFCG
ncbi:MAG TPA: hypothetical protein VGB60_01300 [Brevundimonas sp.]|jgi:hypothetical protein|uniref:hypothetical protein n=1 Tax=Brevundimonas sp. TaxID=1871086 RepID=UPI002ED9018D